MCYKLNILYKRESICELRQGVPVESKGVEICVLFSSRRRQIVILDRAMRMGQVNFQFLQWDAACSISTHVIFFVSLVFLLEFL